MGKRTTVRDIDALYREGTPLTMVTCYDYSFAKLVEQADIELILIGDSLGNVIQGQETTLPVTVEDIIYHTRAVVRGNQSAHIVADLPFMSYQANDDEGIRNAGRLLKEGHAQSVKVEGGERIAPMVERMTRAGIPVMGHLGLTPQSVHEFGGFTVQGRGEAGEQLLEDARALEEAGVYALVLEMVPAELAERVTEAVDIPTIGIGAGAATSGQVLVIYDLLGLDTSFTPKFLKRYAEIEGTAVEALETYREEVRARSFPAEEHSWDDE